MKLNFERARSKRILIIGLLIMLINSRFAPVNEHPGRKVAVRGDHSGHTIFYIPTL